MILSSTLYCEGLLYCHGLINTIILHCNSSFFPPFYTNVARKYIQTQTDWPRSSTWSMHSSEVINLSVCAGQISGGSSTLHRGAYVSPTDDLKYNQVRVVFLQLNLKRCDHFIESESTNPGALTLRVFTSSIQFELLLQALKWIGGPFLEEFCNKPRNDICRKYSQNAGWILLLNLTHGSLRKNSTSSSLEEYSPLLLYIFLASGVIWYLGLKGNKILQPL